MRNGVFMLLLLLLFTMNYIQQVKSTIAVDIGLSVTEFYKNISNHIELKRYSLRCVSY